MKRVLVAFTAMLLFAPGAGDAAEAPRPQKIGVAGYVMVGTVMKLDGVSDNLSGVAWCPTTKSLICVLNGPTVALEVTRSGTVSRRIGLKGFDDTEGVAHARGTRFWVTEEQRGRVVLIDLKPGITEVDYAKVKANCHEIQKPGGNQGLEAVAVGNGVGELYVLKEKSPRRVYHTFLKPKGIRGNCQPVVTSTAWDAEAGAWASAWVGNYDLAGAHFDRRTGHLLVLSHEGDRIVECTRTGTIIETLRLKRALRQPEGITMDDQGTIFVCGEPNELVAFRPKSKK